MAARYSRFYSNYILRKKHQNVTGGSIWERDWVTIGAKHQIEKGKRPFFGDSGFLYTINNIPSTKKRHDFGKWVANWLYPDVEKSQETVNTVEVNRLSGDIRDFVYYGSAVELISSSILNIINTYPPIIYSLPKSKYSDSTIIFPLGNEGQTIEAMGSRLYNPFNVDLIHTDIDTPKSAELHHFLGISYNDFTITLYTSDQDSFGMNGHEMSIDDYIVTTTDIYNENVGCPENYQFQHIITVRLLEHAEDYDIVADMYGYQVYDQIVFTSAKLSLVSDGTTIRDYGTDWYIVIRLRSELIEDFKNNLDPFEQLILREDTIPLYKNSFLTPYEIEDGMHYVYQDYTWPTDNIEEIGVVLDVSSPVYYDYIDRMYRLGQSLDELWTDNLWRNMTHESIKNYDWTYRRTFVEGEEEDNIIGGKRMEHMVRVYGRFFDDIKHYIDGIKLTNRVTYDGYNNRPEAELSDKLDYMGWDIFSTIPTTDEIDVETGKRLSLSEVNLDDDFLSNTDFVIGTREKSGFKPWFTTLNNNNITASLEDNRFMRSLSLSSKYIMKSKGTVNSIEMVMALFGLGNTEEEKFFDVSERYYTIVPHLYDDNEVKMISDLNHRESENYRDDDYFDSIPVGITEIYNGKYIIPFYSNKKYYNGEFTFQSLGGWGANADEDQTDIDRTYIETISYLKVVGNITELLSLNPYDVKKEDIYYVIDLSDLINYNEGIVDYELISDPTSIITQSEYESLSDNEKELYRPILSMMTNFFICTNDVFVERISSWRNIRIDSDEYEKALYLDSIVSTDVGNNPHVGYGNYDLGQEYLDYMETPFKYDLDTYSLNDNVRDDMEGIVFTRDANSAVIEVEDWRDKCIDLISNSTERDKYFVEILRERDRLVEEFNSKILCVDYEEIAQLQHDIVRLNSILNKVRYYLNSKHIILTNTVFDENDRIPDTYKTYFFGVILPYIMQVIPSTAILILKNFN